MRGRLRAAAAGAAAAAVWALQEPVDQRIFRCGYSDVAVLGKAVTRGPHWRTAGLAIHACNGAVFGLSHYEVRRVVPIGSRKLALSMALVEHVALYPLCYLIDLYHPARGEPGVPPLLRNPRAFAQATWRHALFGTILGQLAQPPPAPRSPRPRGCGRQLGVRNVGRRREQGHHATLGANLTGRRRRWMIAASDVEAPGRR